MDKVPVSRRVAASPIASIAAFPMRLATVARHNAGTIRRSGSWLIRSRENACFTYDLQPVNVEHLAWFTATITGRPVAEIRGYITELESDSGLRQFLHTRLAASPRKRTCDHYVRYGRRAVLYAAVRAISPSHVVETGPHRGISSCVIAAAILRNENGGRLTTIDIDPQAGELIHGPYAEVTELVIGDSAQMIAGAPIQERLIDIFVSESHLYGPAGRAEVDAAAAALAPQGLILSVRGALNADLAQWSEERGRHFLPFLEKPRDHWFPGEGYGASYVHA